LLADCQGRRLFVADAHRGDNQRFIMRADEKLTAFAELNRRFEPSFYKIKTNHHGQPSG
jgi:hypothetical protein